MNCPVRTEPFPGEGQNQNPPELAAELTTRRSLNSRRNGSNSASRTDLADGSHGVIEHEPGTEGQKGVASGIEKSTAGVGQQEVSGLNEKRTWTSWKRSGGSSSTGGSGGNSLLNLAMKVRGKLTKYVKFIGPGFMVAVAYIDPGTYILK